MKRIWIAIVSACSTFSVFPTPRISWDRVTLSGTLAALPLVGALIGGAGERAGVARLSWRVSG